MFCLRNYTGFQCFHSRVLLLVLLKQQRSFELFEVLWNGSYYLRTKTTNKTGPKWKTNFTWDGESCRMIRRIIFRKVFLRIFDKQGHHHRHLSYYRRTLHRRLGTEGKNTKTNRPIVPNDHFTYVFETSSPLRIRISQIPGLMGRVSCGGYFSKLCIISHT